MVNQRLNEEKVFDILVRPLVTEKSTRVAADNQYVFEVLPEATKPQIKKAVEKLFKVKVERVTTINMLGKTKRFKGRVGVRSDYKKAIVSLKQGDTIDLSTGN